MKLIDAYFKPERGVSQPEVDRAYVLLERAGFMLDVPYLNQQADIARQDEVKALDFLRETYHNLVPGYAREDYVDGLWSSAPKLDRLVHEVLGLEPSPIWKKGEVNQRKGDRKIDGVALEYLANVNPEFGPLLRGVINLRRVRGCLKYLSKLPHYVQEDGLVHPVYGAPSDDDERAGARSGRSTMKNPEGQQIPNSDEKDPYAIRKGFIAPPGQVLVVRDYAAMEAVLLHCLCLALFNDDSLADANSPTFHSVNAQLVFGKYLGWKHPSGKPVLDFQLDDFKTDPWLIDRRRDAKTVFYGKQFCKSARGFGYTLLDENGYPIGESKAQAICDAFDEARPGLRKWQDYVWNYLWRIAREAGFYPGIAGFSGRWRDVTDLVEAALATGKPDWRFRKAWRQLCNHPEQEGGAAIKTTALVFSQRELTNRFQIGTVQNDIHDELIARCGEHDSEEVDAILTDKMENTYPLPGGVKLKTGGGVATNWYDAK